MADTKQKKYALVVTDKSTGKVLDVIEFAARKDAREERTRKLTPSRVKRFNHTILPLRQGKIRRKPARSKL